MLSNVQHGLEQRGGSHLIMGGCVSDGTRIQSVIVEAHSGSKPNTAVITPKLELAQVPPNTTPNRGDRFQVVICSNGAFEELVFHAWLGLQPRLPPDMRASAGVQQLCFHRGDEFMMQVSCNGGCYVCIHAFDLGGWVQRYCAAGKLRCCQDYQRDNEGA